jgi:hypothetical protein
LRHRPCIDTGCRENRDASIGDVFRQVLRKNSRALGQNLDEVDKGKVQQFGNQSRDGRNIEVGVIHSHYRE